MAGHWNVGCRPSQWRDQSHHPAHYLLREPGLSVIEPTLLQMLRWAFIYSSFVLYRKLFRVRSDECDSLTWQRSVQWYICLFYLGAAVPDFQNIEPSRVKRTSLMLLFVEHFDEARELTTHFINNYSPNRKFHYAIVSLVNICDVGHALYALDIVWMFYLTRDNVWHYDSYDTIILLWLCMIPGVDKDNLRTEWHIAR